ncbi:uncharacterized protein [Procambarus clarkii]|uniref:uncharacterized protein n=1 Tax=Procambarus clarkii TaxID=6728 RepID=UPI001E67244D|nr:uncharacterized protein LOC123749706 [Procambarus clarkii]
MLNILIHGAVPFGYTTEMNNMDLFVTDEMYWENLQNRRGLPATLPDVILSNTPPPSPLRRAQSYLSFFPEKSPHALPVLPTLDTPPATPSDPTVGVARAASVGRLEEGGRDESVKTSLEHIQEVRRRLQSDHPHPPNTLPQLSWPLPRPHRSPQRQGEESSLEDGDRAQDDEIQYRRVGRELRKIADQFHVSNAKVSTKEGDQEPASLRVPVALTRCVSASILALIWWRLFNKFH